MAQLRWYTTRFNRCFVRMGQCKPRLLCAWFTLGAWFGVLLMFVGAVLLTMTLFKSVSQKAGEPAVLTPVVSSVVISSKSEKSCMFLKLSRNLIYMNL